MWPFRPEKLTDVLARDDIRALLQLGDPLGSAVTLIEKAAADAFERLDAERGDADRRTDPFCTTFRHGRVGGKPAFDGANEACENCELRFARRLLSPAPGADLPARPSGAAALRCHMGLTDYQAAVTIGGKTVASLIAGRRVESEDDRLRIRKAVGKLGKLTRAEAENAGAVDRLVEPIDEKARERLLQEIPSIPLRSEALEKGLVQLSRLLSRLASRQFETVRRGREDALVERIDARHGEVPAQLSGLRQQTSALLADIRDELAVEFLAFFAALPRELDDPGVRPSLVAETGLDLQTGRRLLELDPSKLPSLSLGREAEVTRGLSAVSTLTRALVEARDTPGGLKDRLTKSMFVAPVEFGPHLRAILCFGPTRNAAAAEPADYQFLARVGRAVTRHYYAIAVELERRWLTDRLQNEGSARRDAEATARELERTEGFTFFDARKVLNQCVERAASRLQERGVELDTRDCLERVTLRADRKEITDLFRRIVGEGIERALVDPETRKGPPLRVFLRRSRTRLFFGVELIGDFLGPQERRALFAPDQAPPAGDGNGEPRAPRSLAAEMETLRRHGGRLRVDSERLHRWEKDRNRWLGKTTFVVELPLPERQEPATASSPSPAAASAAGSGPA